MSNKAELDKAVSDFAKSQHKMNVDHIKRALGEEGLNREAIRGMVQEEVKRLVAETIIGAHGTIVAQVTAETESALKAGNWNGQAISKVVEVISTREIVKRVEATVREKLRFSFELEGSSVNLGQRIRTGAFYARNGEVMRVHMIDGNTAEGWYWRDELNGVPLKDRTRWFWKADTGVSVCHTRDWDLVERIEEEANLNQYLKLKDGPIDTTKVDSEIRTARKAEG